MHFICATVIVLGSALALLPVSTPSNLKVIPSVSLVQECVNKSRISKIISTDFWLSGRYNLVIEGATSGVIENAGSGFKTKPGLQNLNSEPSSNEPVLYLLRSKGDEKLLESILELQGMLLGNVNKDVKLYLARPVWK